MSVFGVLGWAVCGDCLKGERPRTFPQFGVTSPDGAHHCHNHGGGIAAILRVAAINPPQRLSPEAVAVLLCANPVGPEGYTARQKACLVLDGYQTPSERRNGETFWQNFEGWRKFDASFGSSLAAGLIKFRRWSARQEETALNLLLKYSAQLARIAAARAAAQEVEEAVEVAEEAVIVTPPPAPVPALPAAPAAKRKAARIAAAKKPAAKKRATKAKA